MLAKGNFTRDEWNPLLYLFNISHFSSTDCSDVMSKRTQEESGQERVTAKLRPMMSLIARAPSNLSSSTSEIPGKRSYGSQDPWRAKAEKEDRTGQPVVGSDPTTLPHFYHEQSTESSFSARYSKWDDNKAWSSQEWKADPPMGDITGQPVVYPQRETRPQQFIIGNDETESELSVDSRSFLNRVNDQVRKRQKRSSMNVTENEDKHSMIWGLFMSVSLESALFMGKNYLDNRHSITNTKDLTLKQMFDISARLVSEQDEISGLETIGRENHSWKFMSLIDDERVINLQRTKAYVFSDYEQCLGKILENPQSNDAWEQRLGWFTSSPEYRNFDRIDGEPMEFEWNISQGRIIYMSMFNSISCGSRDNEKECGSNAHLVSFLQDDLEQDNSHFLVLVHRRSGIQSVKIVHKENGDNMAERMMLEFAESGHPISVLQVHCSEVDSKAKAMENCRYTIVPIWKRLRLFFAQLFL